MSRYVSQYSFSMVGAEHLNALRELRLRLSAFEGKALSEIYMAFNLPNPFGAADKSFLDKVDVVHTIKGQRHLYGHFVFATSTEVAQHQMLWIAIAKQYHPHVRLDHITNGEEGERMCGELYVPAEQIFYNRNGKR